MSIRPAEALICVCLNGKPIFLFRKAASQFELAIFSPLFFSILPKCHHQANHKPRKLQVRSPKSRRKKGGSTSKPKSSTKPSVPEVVAPVEDEGWEDEDSDEEEDEDDDGVDEEGMARLMELLGDDGLDELGQAQLEAFAAEDEDDDDSSNEGDVEDEDGGSASEDEDVEANGASGDEIEGSNDEADEGVEEDGEEDEEDIPLDEVDSVDEDAVPRQKIEIDNKVRYSLRIHCFLTQLTDFPGCS
jgi:rRNA-processing protein EBP2